MKTRATALQTQDTDPQGSANDMPAGELKDSDDDEPVPRPPSSNRQYQLTQDSDYDPNAFSDAASTHSVEETNHAWMQQDQDDASDAGSHPNLQETKEDGLDDADKKPQAQPSCTQHETEQPANLISPIKPTQQELGNLQRNMAIHDPVRQAALQDVVDARYPKQAPESSTGSAPQAAKPEGLPTQQVIKLKRQATQDISPNSKKANFDLDRISSSIKTILYTVSLISGDTLTITERKKGLEPPYLVPIATLFRDSDAHMKESAKTDFFAYERRPNDPNRVMEYVNKNKPANPF